MKRPPGRPPLDASATDPSADVHLTLPARDYDRVEQLAKARRQSIQDVIRLGLKRLLTDHQRPL
jgi:hypothetical protein